MERLSWAAAVSEARDLVAMALADGGRRGRWALEAAARVLVEADRPPARVDGSGDLDMRTRRAAGVLLEAARARVQEHELGVPRADCGLWAGKAAAALERLAQDAEGSGLTETGTDNPAGLPLLAKRARALLEAVVRGQAGTELYWREAAGALAEDAHVCAGLLGGNPGAEAMERAAEDLALVRERWGSAVAPLAAARAAAAVRWAATVVGYGATGTTCRPAEQWVRRGLEALVRTTAWLALAREAQATSPDPSERAVAEALNGLVAGGLDAACGALMMARDEAVAAGGEDGDRVATAVVTARAAVEAARATVSSEERVWAVAEAVARAGRAAAPEPVAGA